MPISASGSCAVLRKVPGGAGAKPGDALRRDLRAARRACRDQRPASTGAARSRRRVEGVGAGAVRQRSRAGRGDRGAPHPAAARGAVRGRAAGAARTPGSSTTSRRRRPTMRWWRSCASCRTTAGTAASRRGRTSSRCSRRRSASGGARGRSGRSRSRKRAWHGSPTRAASRTSTRRRPSCSPRSPSGSAWLTPRQRTVLVAITLDGVPIDVLAERMASTRGALYKTLHDARRSLRARLALDGLAPDGPAPTRRPPRPEGGRP